MAFAPKLIDDGQAWITMMLDNLPLPYKFDVTSLASIQYLPVREHIDRVGITIYKKGLNIL